MPTVTELEPEDSGVSSSEITPEGQINLSDNPTTTNGDKTEEMSSDKVEESVSSSDKAEEPAPSSVETVEEAIVLNEIGKTEEAAAAAKNIVGEVLSSAAVKMEEEKKKKEPTPVASTLSVSLKNGKSTVEDVEDDDDEDIDETVFERIIGLSEMFPSSLRSVSSKLVSGSISALKGGYAFTRQAVWVAISTSVILFAPVMFEVERLNVEEMMKQDRNRLVLGPGSAMSGPPGAGGLAPPPPAR